MNGSILVAAVAACARRIGVFALPALLAAFPNLASAISSDLGITVATSNTAPTAGGAPFSYTVVVANTGVNAAFGIRVVTVLPPGVVFQNVSIVNNPSIAGYALVCAGPPVDTNGEVTCRGVQPGASGGSPSISTITINAQVVPSAYGIRSTLVSVMSDTQEATPDTAPNAASIQQTIQVYAPLALSIQATAAVVARDPILYQVAIVKIGTSDALSPTLTLNLPTGTQFLHMHESNALDATCYASGGGTQVTCKPASIPAGTHHLVVIAETFLGTTPAGTAQATATLDPGSGTVSGSPANASTAIVTAVMDIDSNGAYDALSDGLILLRNLFGLNGASMVAGALGTNSTRTDPTQIGQYLSAVKPFLDVDGNGAVDALTDGLMIVRYLFGLRGAQMIAGAVGTGATRTTATDIETYIQTLTP